MRLLKTVKRKGFGYKFIATYWLKDGLVYSLGTRINTDGSKQQRLTRLKTAFMEIRKMICNPKNGQPIHRTVFRANAE